MAPNLSVKNKKISVKKVNGQDYLCLTDMLEEYGNEDSIKNWLRSKDTLDFLAVWERLNNEDFKTVEFDRLRNEAWTNRFVMSVSKWIDTTWAKGIYSQKGKQWGTYAQVDIALEFASWLNPEFKLYVVQEFQRLKTQEQQRLDGGRDVKRFLSKMNFAIMTESIKKNLVPEKIKPSEVGLIYAEESDIVNLALYGMTAAERRKKNPTLAKEGNMREFSTPEQLLVLSNIEFMNSELIEQGVDASKRLKELNKIAVKQMEQLTKKKSVQRLGGSDNTPNYGKK